MAHAHGAGQATGRRLSDEHINPDAHGVSIAFDTNTGAPSIETPIPIAARMAPEGDVVIKMAKLKEWALDRRWRD